MERSKTTSCRSSGGGVYVYPWGTAVKEQRTDKWTTICIGDQELDVTDRSIILHENGIEFVK